VAMIETEYCFSQLQRKGALRNAVKLHQAMFGKAPEVFDSIGVVRPQTKSTVTVSPMIPAALRDLGVFSQPLAE